MEGGGVIIGGYIYIYLKMFEKRREGAIIGGDVLGCLWRGGEHGWKGSGDWSVLGKG